MAKNEYQVQRTAYGTVALSVAGSATSSIGSGAIIPAGAIITGLRINTPNAVTLTNASATVVPRVGATNIAATTNMSDLPAQTVPTIVALATTDGIYVTADGEFNIQVGTTNTSTAAGTYEYFVDYLYVV